MERKRAYNKEYHSKNREAIAARAHERYAANKSERAAYRKEYYARNRLAILAEKKDYSAKNKYRIKEYYAKNRLVIAAKKKKFRAKGENRDAARAYQKEYLAKNKSATLARAKEYYAKNRDVILAKGKEYEAKNKEARAAHQKAYRAKNRPSIAAKEMEYRAKNPEKGRAKNHRRRVRMMGGDGKIDPAISKWSKAWHALKKVRCYWCEETFSPKACHEDHIVAVSIGGQHEIANMCISCAPCNLRKWAHPIPTWNAMLSSPVLAL